ncbi:MAG: Pr6Pr family membrane protein [Ferruginibacter sp.]
MSFFTILSNIMVSICFFADAFTADFRMKFWKSAPVKTALLVYILVVGIVYNVVLRSLWEPLGWQIPVDEMLHVVMPLLFLLYWWWFSPSIHFRWSNVTKSLLYPILYLIWVLLRGALSNWYPYPFLDAFNHGYKKVAISSIVLLLLFGSLSVLLFWWSSRKKATPDKT